VENSNSPAYNKHIYKDAITTGNYGIIEYYFETQELFISDIGIQILGLRINKVYTIESIKQALLTDEKGKLDNLIESIERVEDYNNISVKIHKPTSDDATEIKSVQAKIKLLNRKNGIPEKALIVFEDITEQKRQEKELQRAKEKAIESEKLKTAFLVNMSHEIRNPMNAIIGFSELMNIGNPSYESRKEWASLIKSKGKQLLSFIDDLMEVSKLESGEVNISKSECNLNQLIWESKSVYDQVKIEKDKQNIDIRINVPAIPIVTYTDYGRVSRF
jgi:signal transduction histidine kinase